MSSPPKLPPEAPGADRFGHLKAIRDDPLGTLTTAFNTHGDVSGFRFGPFKAALLADPEHIEHILIAGREKYDKKVLSYQTMRLLLGDGLLTSGGELWRRQRRIATPAFQRRRILSFGDLIVAEAERTAEKWRANAGATVDMHRDMMALTLRVAAGSLLGVDVERHTPLVKEALEAALDYIDYRIHHPLSPPSWVPTPRNLRFKRQRRRLVQLVRGIIAERRSSGADLDDFLGRLMKARDEQTGESMSDRQLQDEVMTILLAGHETTAGTLTFTWLLLSSYPQAAARLHRELDQVLGGRAPTTDDLSRLPYTKAVIEESMRLMPPAWIIERRALEDDRVGGFDLPKGSIALISQWITHRHPRFWPEPEVFKPERFLVNENRLGDESRGRHRFAYFPFGGGERVCIGGSFALLESRLMLATLAQRFEPRQVDGFALELDAAITLRPRNGLPMILRKRHDFAQAP